MKKLKAVIILAFAMSSISAHAQWVFPPVGFDVTLKISVIIGEDTLNIDTNYLVGEHLDYRIMVINEQGAISAEITTTTKWIPHVEHKLPWLAPGSYAVIFVQLAIDPDGVVRSHLVGVYDMIKK